MHECLWQFAAAFRHLPCWCCRGELLAWAEPTSSTQKAKAIVLPHGGFKFALYTRSKFANIQSREKVSAKQGCSN